MPPASVSNDFPLTLAALHCHGTPAPTEDGLSWACCLDFMKSQQCCLLAITAILRSVLSRGKYSLLCLKKASNLLSIASATAVQKMADLAERRDCGESNHRNMGGRDDMFPLQEMHHCQL